MRHGTLLIFIMISPDQKSETYRQIIKTLDAVLETEPPLTTTAKMASIASVLHTGFPQWTFCGFYTVVAPDLLEIGPYQGHVLACTHIHFGKGVCGVVASTQKTCIVDDVLTYPNYISCDAETRSEIVIPILKDKQTTAVLDIDAPTVAAFDKEIDQLFLEKIVQFI